MDSTSLNIVLLPDAKVHNAAIKLSEDLNKTLPTKIVLNGIDLIPHLTIYQAEFPSKNVEIVIDEIAQILKNIDIFEVNMNKFWASPQGNIWWNSEKNENMEKLQKESINRCNKLREELLLPGLKEAKNISLDFKNEVENYGTLWVGERYTPHLSISAMNPDLNEKTLEFLGNGKKMSFIASRFAVGTLGIYGTVTSIIKEYKI